jgi:hypothetical protein
VLKGLKCAACVADGNVTSRRIRPGSKPASPGGGVVLCAAAIAGASRSIAANMTFRI